MNVLLPGYEPIGVACATPRSMLYRARRLRDGVTVLLKVPRSGEATALRRLRHEFAIVRRIESPYVVRYHELIEHDGQLAVALDDIDGVPLSEAVPEGGMALGDWLGVGVALAAGLEAIHAAGVVHRDVHPGSILVERAAGRVLYVDVGLAEPVLPQGAPVTPALLDANLAYVSPEETGRVERPVDHRSDLYSLGATLYELACGVPPFGTDDPLALLHAHIARPAPSPRERKPSIPPVIAAIVTKLLAKSPDDRYQTARGLRADLERLRGVLARGAWPVEFVLGAEDVAARLDVPDRLYGRDTELGLLREAWARVGESRRELVLVAGPPGVGKTALVSELRTTVVERGGFFAAGKFEQLGGVPYGPIKQAFGDLVRQLLGEADVRIEEWRRRFGDALGGQASVIVTLVPELEWILGPQPDVEPLGPVDAQNRFTRLFRRFAGTFARRAHPLVLFLDDWQWADVASLTLIEGLATDPDVQALLLIGAYRDTEVDDAHPAMATAARIREMGVPATRVAVRPLGHAPLLQILVDTLRCSPAHAEALAAAIEARTGGNPFFVRALLHSLRERGILTFDPRLGWRACLDELGLVSEAEDILQLTAARLERLPAPTRDLLQLAASLGSEFRLAELAVAAGWSEERTAGALAPAVDGTLVVRRRSSWCFVHDRVQEAAYNLVDGPARNQRHLDIGRRLLAAPAEADGPSGLTRPVEHLNRGRTCLAGSRERLTVARLNLEAGRLARQATAYAAAAAHAAVGMELLPLDAWQTEYRLALDAHALRAEAEYLSGNFATAEAVYPIALREARTHLDRIRILKIRKDQYELQGRYAEAVAILREGLTHVGVALPTSEEALRDLLRAELRLLPEHLGGRAIASLVDAPEVTDPELIARLELLMGMWPSCYVLGSQTLLAVVSAKIANFCLAYGNSEIAPAAYVNYSFVAGYVTGDYLAAYEFGRLGITLADRYPNRSVRSWCYFLFGCGTALWRQPLAQAVQFLERSFELGIDSGNIASASYAGSYIVTDSFFRGVRLADVQELYGRFAEFLRRNNPAILVFLELGIRSLHRLTGRQGPDEAVLLARVGASEFFGAAHRFGELPAAYLLDEGETVVRQADAALAAGPQLLAGTFKVVETLTLAALTYLRHWAGAPAHDRARFDVVVTGALDELRRLAAQCPANVEHKVLLLEAERARVDGRLEVAPGLYDRAAEAAAREGFVQYEALANELAGRFWHARGHRKVAAVYLREAQARYHAWGAVAKVALLEREFAELIGAPARPAGGAGPVAREEASLGAERFDMLAMARAWEALSREVEHDRLVSTLMRIIVHNAGAERGALVLRIDGELRVVASAENGGESILLSGAVSLTASPAVAESVVRYAARTGETVLLENAAERGLFIRDPYVQARALRSVLCVPIRVKDETIGVAYVENNLSAGAFNPARAFVLELLAGQAAISLENARLYGDLKRSMASLDASRREAEAANRAKDEFLAMLSHELRNPLGAIGNAARVLHGVVPPGGHAARAGAVIDRQVGHLARLVDDLLDVGRVTMGKIVLDRQALDLAGVVSDVVTGWRGSGELARHRVGVEVEPVWVEADETRLEQIVTNLLGNALKYTPPGGDLAVRVKAEGAEAVLEVEDTGIGISPELLERIFDLFVQGDRSLDRAAAGLGIGLTLVRRLVQMHGGTVDATSAGPGRGSLFRVRLPRVAAPPRRPPPAADGGAGPPRRILIVEDNEDAREMLRVALEGLGHAVYAAADGRTGVELAVATAPDVGLVDIGLPGIDGYEVARRLRATSPGNVMTLIALTGYGHGDDARRAAEAGFDTHLVKPVDPLRLGEIIARLSPVRAGSPGAG
jgi:predicted ATPase/signal transduction histidine kinase